MEYNVILNLTRDTNIILNERNFTLCCFIASQSDSKSSAAPLCWSTVNNFLTSVKITWIDKLSSYVSTSEIAENNQIYISQPLTINTNSSSINSESASAYKIALKNRMLVEDYGNISIDTINTEDDILIQNESGLKYTTGISVTDDSGYYSGICAFPLYGNHSIRVKPDCKIFLFFTTKNIKNNTVLYKTDAHGMYIDFNGAQDNTRTVEYDINGGWNANGATWAKKYPSNSDLRQILIK